MPTFKITQGEVDILKHCAAIESSPPVSISNMLLEPGLRCNVEDPTITESSMNVRLISKDPEWNDTDLDDYGLWKDFRAGIELTEDGAGIVDFYIRKKKMSADDDYLFGNIQCVIEGGKMVRVEAQGTVLWPEEKLEGDDAVFLPGQTGRMGGRG